MARVIDVIAPAVFGRPLNLYWDGRHGWQLLRMVADGWPAGAVAAAAVLGCAALAGLLWAVHSFARKALGALARSFERTAVRPWIAACGLVLVVCFIAPAYLGRDTRWFFSLPVAPSLVRQLNWLPALGAPALTEARLGPSPAFETDLSTLAGADVLLIFAESYGSTTLDVPAQRAALAPARVTLRQALDAAGRGVVSARVRSPTFAGGSWLAHAALLSGIDTRDPAAYDLLLADRAADPGGPLPAPRLPHGGLDSQGCSALGRRGASTASTASPAPTRSAMRGRPSATGASPDQASMARLQAEELDRDAAAGAPRTPRFIVFPTVNKPRAVPAAATVSGGTGRGCCAPMPTTPRRWAAALQAPVSWTDPTAAYLQSIVYTHQWLASYLRDRAPPDLVTIVIGDHQPLAAVSGREASWDVPVHVIARNPALLRRFVDAGFSPGLEPASGNLTDMPGLTSLIVRAFGS